MNEDKRTKSKTNSFLIIPILVSLTWLGLITYFLYWKFQSIDQFLKQDFNALGDYFAGAFAPLATFWLVYAVLIQSRQLKMQALELNLQREELKETRKTLEAQRLEMAEAAKQAKAQAEAIRANTRHAAKDTFFRMYSMFEDESRNILASILDGLTVTRFSNNRANFVSLNEELWSNVIGGNKYSFHYYFLKKYLDPNKEQFHIFVNRIKQRKILSLRYISLYENIISECFNIDNDNKIITNEIENNFHSEVYLVLFSIFCEGSVKFQCRDPENINIYREILKKDF